MKHEDYTTLCQGSLLNRRRANSRRLASRGIGLALCFVLLASSLLKAQTTTGSVVGMVTDASNAAIHLRRST